MGGGRKEQSGPRAEVGTGGMRMGSAGPSLRDGQQGRHPRACGTGGNSPGGCKHGLEPLTQFRGLWLLFLRSAFLLEPSFCAFFPPLRHPLSSEFTHLKMKRRWGGWFQLIFLALCPHTGSCVWFCGDPRGVCELPVTTGEREVKAEREAAVRVSEQKCPQARLYLKREPEREHGMFFSDPRILNSIKWINLRICLRWYPWCLPGLVIFPVLCVCSPFSPGLRNWSGKLVPPEAGT